MNTEAAFVASMDARGRVFLGETRGREEANGSSKTVVEELNLKLRLKFNPDSTNNDCLHCATLKTFKVLKKKETTRQEIVNFFFIMFKIRFLRCS